MNARLTCLAILAFGISASDFFRHLIFDLRPSSFRTAIKWQKKAIEMNRHPKEKDRLGAQEHLALYQAGMPFRDPEVSHTPVEEK